jgi:hypothetical protein
VSLPGSFHDTDRPCRRQRPGLARELGAGPSGRAASSWTPRPGRAVRPAEPTPAPRVSRASSRARGRSPRASRGRSSRPSTGLSSGISALHSAPEHSTAGRTLHRAGARADRLPARGRAAEDSLRNRSGRRLRALRDGGGWAWPVSHPRPRHGAIRRADRLARPAKRARRRRRSLGPRSGGRAPLTAGARPGLRRRLVAGRRARRLLVVRGTVGRPTRRDEAAQAHAARRRRGARRGHRTAGRLRTRPRTGSG